MPQSLTVYKASAGSGKTFTLAVEYILLLLQDELGSEFQHTLAVTFTNKATSEMKDRILQTLYGLAYHLPSSNKYLEAIQKRQAEMGVVMDESTIRTRSGNALKAILHDFDHFRVETIDSFFQSILRDLARELRLSANLQVDLNNDQVISLAVDRIVDNLQNSPTIEKWVLDYVHSQIEENGQWNIISALKGFAKCIFSEHFQDRSEEDRQHLNDEQLIATFVRKMKELEDESKQALIARVKEVRETINNQALNFENISYRSTYESFLDKVESLGKPNKPEFGARMENAKNDPMTMLTKPNQKKPELVAQTGPTIQLFVDLKEQYDQCMFVINSARLSRKNVNPLRLLSTIEDEITRINSENNQFTLSKTPALLKQLQTSDAPFIFEKTGTWFHNIMIDEFQDTSRLQWQNFKTLLINDQAAGGKDLLVGDIKQSIYRWRNGDWSILNNIGREFSWICPDVKDLKINYRSRHNIIEFNNQFFDSAAKVVDGLMEEPRIRVQDLYKDVQQKFPKSEDAGHIRCCIYQASKKSDVQEEYEERMTLDMIEQIRLLREKGLPYQKIAILVRENRFGSALIENFHRLAEDIPLVSDEAFLLSASLSVGMIVNALRVLADRSNSNIPLRYLVLHYLQDIRGKGKDLKVEDYINCTPEEILPSEFFLESETLARMPLYLLCERIYQIFHLDQLQGQEPYLYTFYDELQHYLLQNPSDIHSFLSAWDETIYKASIPSGEVDGIRILTIHRSKGLQFHTVLIPYCDWTIPRLEKQTWCRPTEEPYNQLGLLRINTYGGFADSIYRPDYEEETLQCYIDNINLLYVAFTRAEQNLMIWGFSDEMKEGKIGHIGGIILAGLGLQAEAVSAEGETSSLKLATYQKGELITTFGHEDESDNRMNPNYQPITTHLLSNPPMLDFQQSNESRRFILSLDDEREENHVQSYLEIGKLMHYVLSQVENVRDIDSVLQRCRIQGLIQNEEMQQSVLAAIHRGLGNPLIASWFDAQNQVINESSITSIDPASGLPRVVRPDRVVLRGGKLTVIDYKFANSRTTHRAQEYQEQVLLYMDLLRQMNPTLQVEGFLWYIYDNAVVAVQSQKKGDPQ